MINNTAISIFIISLALTTPVFADRELPAGADPGSVLSAFFTDVKSTLDDPENKNPSLNATYANAAGYWIRSSRESVQKTGQVADLSSVMFLLMNRPTSWTIDDMRIAGDFARARVSFSPSASSGVVREREYDPIEARFDLVAQNDDWFIVSFKGPQKEQPTPLPDALPVDDKDTPETLVSRYMDVVLEELGPTSGPPGGRNVVAVSAKLEDMWVDSRDARRSFGQNLSFMTILQPKSWQLTKSVVTGNSAEVVVTFESDSPMATSLPTSNGSQSTPTLRFNAEREGEQWKLTSVIR
jgi:hypothetical protein